MKAGGSGAVGGGDSGATVADTGSVMCFDMMFVALYCPPENRLGIASCFSDLYFPRLQN